MLHINTLNFVELALPHKLRSGLRIIDSLRLASVTFVVSCIMFHSTVAYSVSTSPYLDTTTFDRSLYGLQYSVDPYVTEEDMSWVDETNDFLSKFVLDFSEYIDHGLAKDENEEPIVNRSYIKLRTSAEYSYRGDLDLDNSISVRIDLPHTQRDWKLIIETDPNDYDDLESKQRGITSASNGKNEAFGGVRLQDQQISRWKTSFDLGVKIRLPLDVFTRAELHRVHEISDDWTTQFVQEIFYYHSKGPGSLTELNFYLAVDDDKKQIFKISSSAQYLYDDDRWELLHQALFFDRLSDRHLMQYSIGVSALPYEKDEISNYWVSASWIQKLYKHWLFLTITPQLEAPREYDYKLNPGVFMELEAFFSKNRKADRLNRTIPESTSRPN